MNADIYQYACNDQRPRRIWWGILQVAVENFGWLKYDFEGVIGVLRKSFQPILYSHWMYDYEDVL